MFISFFNELRAAKLPVTLKEYLLLLEGMQKRVIPFKVEDFYYLSRAALVKDEKNLDKFDVGFSHVLKGFEMEAGTTVVEIPAEWLAAIGKEFLTPEDMKEIEAMGGLEKLLETVQMRLADQKERHEGGNKWIGTKGKAPHGNQGDNPEA